MYQLGDIGFVITARGGGIYAFMARLIAKCMGSKWSHSFLVVDPYHTIETDQKSVHVNTLADHTEDKNKDLEIWRPSNLTHDDLLVITQEASKQLGRYYSYPMMLAMGLRLLFKRKIPVLWPWGNVCHSIPMRSLVKLKLIDSKLNQIDTEELYQFIIKSGKFVRVL